MDIELRRPSREMVRRGRELSDDARNVAMDAALAGAPGRSAELACRVANTSRYPLALLV